MMTPDIIQVVLEISAKLSLLFQKKLLPIVKTGHYPLNVFEFNPHPDKPLFFRPN